jgi:hypothetical protein
MRKWAWILLAMAGLSCNRDNNSFLFEIPFPNLDFTIPAGLNPLDTWYFNIDNVPTNALALFSANGIDTASVRSLVPNTARMLSLFNNVDYDFVYEIAVHLCEQGDQTPRCGKEIFYRFPLPNNPGPFVDLVPNPVEVGSLILKDKVNVQVVLRFISPPPQFVETRLDLGFVVK